MNLFDKILKKLYLNNFFKASVYLIKLISFFNKNINSRLVFYNFFKKRRINYSQPLLIEMYDPKVFIFDVDINTEEIKKKIYYYKSLNKFDAYKDAGHVNTYQSEHNLHLENEFIEISNYLQNFINKNISNYYNFEKILIKKMWFVITKELGRIQKHSHFDSDLSGVLYLQVNDRNPNVNDGLKVYNPNKNLKVYKYSSNKSNFDISLIKDKFFIFKPKVNNLIIFNSYLEHSVDNFDTVVLDRISLPIDMHFIN